MSSQRKCLECDDVLVGRSDKKFCSDQCRNAFNNRINSDTTKTVRNINNILRRNRRILDELCPEGKTVMKRDRLIQAGFSFTYFTHQYKNKKGDVYHFCYELGYLPFGEGEVLIVRRDDAT